MQAFKFNLSFVHKIQDKKLLLLSTDSDQNEIYEFEGISSEIITFFISQDQFTFEMAEVIARKHHADLKDLKVLWDFCIEVKLIVSAT